MFSPPDPTEMESSFSIGVHQKEIARNIAGRGYNKKQCKKKKNCSRLRGVLRVVLTIYRSRVIMFPQTPKVYFGSICTMYITETVVTRKASSSAFSSFHETK